MTKTATLMVGCVFLGFLEWVLHRVLPRSEQRAHAVSVVHRAHLPHHGGPLRGPSPRRRSGTLTEHLRQEVRHPQAGQCTQVKPNSTTLPFTTLFTFYSKNFYICLKMVFF